jgi:hypothetical protein
VALPKNTETPRTLELQAIVSAAHEKELEIWPVAKSADYAVIGQFITLFGYIDLNLRRIVEAAAAAGVLEENKTKACDLKIDKVETAIQSLPGMPVENKRAIAYIKNLRLVRNLLAHFAVKRFPNDDAYCFLTKSAEDFREAMNVEPEPHVLMTAVLECKALSGALSEVVGLEKWLSYVAAELVKRFAAGMKTAAP